MRVSATSGGKSATTEGVMFKPTDGELTVVYRKLETIESIALGFRAEMFALTDENDKEVGSVDSGGGFGSDALTLTWGKDKALVRGLDLLKAWVAIVDPDALERLP